MIKWTKEMDETLTGLVNRGSTKLEAAVAMNLTPRQVSSRMRNLGLFLTDTAFIRSRAVNIAKTKATKKERGIWNAAWEVPPVPQTPAAQAAQRLRKVYKSVWYMGRENPKLKGIWCVEGRRVPEREMIKMSLGI